MSQDKKDKKARRKEKVRQEIEAIQEVALSGSEENNRVSKELTFAQASSIRFRSRQLIRESKSHPADSPAKIAKQIEECWRLHEQGRA